MMGISNMHRYACCPMCKLIGSLDHMYHFYNDCPAVLRARQILINAYQHPDIVINFNQAALYPLRAVDPYLLAFLAFPFPSSPAFSNVQLRFITDFVLIFNWCAWDIRKEAKSDPSMVDPSCPDRIVNKIVMLTISTLNRFYKSKLLRLGIRSSLLLRIRPRALFKLPDATSRMTLGISPLRHS